MCKRNHDIVHPKLTQCYMAISINLENTKVNDIIDKIIKI